MPSQSKITSDRLTPDRAVLAGLLLTAAVYCQDLKYDFVIDDIQLVLMNQATATWHNLKMIFTTDVFFQSDPHVPFQMAAQHYRPIFMLWLMLNQRLFGSVFPWWHLTSLLLHICVVFLVYKLGVNLLKDTWAAALAALLFAFHPIHVESVSYVSASTDLLVTLFLLLSFLAYSRFREQGASAVYLVAAIFAAALAMLSKETGAMFPWILLAYEGLRERPEGKPRRWTDFLWTLPFFVVVGAYAVARTLLLGGGLSKNSDTIRPAALLNAPLVLMTYVRNLLWSAHMSFFYPAQWFVGWSVLKGCAFVLFLAVVALLWKNFQDRPNLRMQMIWTAILFVPALSAISAFPPEDWVHDRHMYIVSVPFCLVIASLLMDAKIPRKASLIAGSAIVAILLVQTATQVPRFTNGLTLFKSAMEVAPRSALAHRDYAVALCSYGRYEEALTPYRTAAELDPDNPTSYGSYAEALTLAGHYDEASAQYSKALQWAPASTPYRAFLLYRIALLKVKHSDPAEGEGYLRQAIQIDPQAPSYHAILAEVLRQQGRNEEADQETLAEASIHKNLAHATPIPDR